MIEKLGPCLEKNCSWCCNPVKVIKFFPENKIPVNKEGKKIWQKRNEILIPENQIDTTRIDTYNCDNFDSQTGQCKDYTKTAQKYVKIQAVLMTNQMKMPMNSIKNLLIKNLFQ
jgi:Zn-finger protein